MLLGNRGLKFLLQCLFIKAASKGTMHKIFKRQHQSCAKGIFLSKSSIFVSLVNFSWMQLLMLAVHLAICLTIGLHLLFLYHGPR